MKQVCLNHHQSGQDELFYTSFLTLSDYSMTDIMPLVSQIQTTDKFKDISHAVLSFLKLGLSDIIPDFLKKISRRSFINNNIRKHEWIIRVVKEADFPLTPANYRALVVELPSHIRASLLLQCCNEGATPSNVAFISELVATSYQDQTLVEVFRLLLKSVGHLTAASYVDECLLYTLPSFNSSDLLTFVRYLADHHILGMYEQKFWMIVAYDKKDDGKDLLIDILQDLYPNEESSAYFSLDDLHNLLTMVKSVDIKQILQRKYDILENQKDTFEYKIMNLEIKSTAKLFQFGKNLSFVLLKEDYLLYRISKLYGIHSTTYLMQNLTDFGKNTDHLTELLRQIEEKKDYKMLGILMRYYGVFLPVSIREHGKKLLSQNSKAKNVRVYENFTETQMYYYSYVTHMPHDDDLIKQFLEKKLNPQDICNLLLVQYFHYPEYASTALSILSNNKEYHRYLTKNDKALLKLLSKINESSKVQNSAELSDS